MLASSGTTPNSYLYASEQLDGSLAAYYVRARYLNHISGRFLTVDQFNGLEQDPITLHKYVYAAASPVNQHDPSGFLAPTPPVISPGLLLAAVVFLVLVILALLIFVVPPWRRGPKDDEPEPKRAAMRVQLQKSPRGHGGTSLTWGLAAMANDPPGVTVSEFSARMDQLVALILSGGVVLPWFPVSALGAWLSGAVEELKLEILTIQAAGGISGAQKSFRNREIDYKKHNYRVDLDNLAGWNLRS